jgi:hypothetical protein
MAVAMFLPTFDNKAGGHFTCLKSLELLEVSIAFVTIRFHILFSGCNIVKIFDYQLHYFF